MTASDLSRYFSVGKAKVDEDAKSRMTEISKGTFRSRFSRHAETAEATKDREETSPKIEEQEQPTGEEAIQEITYESEKSDDGDAIDELFEPKPSVHLSETKEAKKTID